MRRFKQARAFLGSITLVGVAALVATPALGGPREQARRMHDRLVGVPPSEGVLDMMETKIRDGDAVGAAADAMLHPEFYTTQLKRFVTPWTNEERTAFAPLNDYSATVIGMIRDRVPFDQVLSADLVYRGADSLGLTAYSQTDNQHYVELEERHLDLSDPTVLVPVQQSTLPDSQISSNEAAGVTTTRAAAQAFFSAGTNRRMLRFTALNYLCRDMEDLQDITRPVDRIRQDVTRSPGGDSSVFRNTCVGCHTGMDPMAQAYAYFEWDPDQGEGRMLHTPGEVQPKYLINDSVFPFGYITTTNRWDNFWREGPNQHLGWRGPSAGGWGAQSLGVEIASSVAFSECQVEKVFEHVCFRPPGNPAERAEVTRIAGEFETRGYDMQVVFAEVAAYCMGN